MWIPFHIFFVLFVLLHSNPFPPLDFKRVVIGHTDELFFHSFQCFFIKINSQIASQMERNEKHTAMTSDGMKASQMRVMMMMIL